MQIKRIFLPINSFSLRPLLSLLPLLLLLCSSMTSVAQVTLRGKVVDSISGGILTGASVYLTHHREVGTVADVEGYFKLTIPPHLVRKDLSISASMVGFRESTVPLFRTKVTRGNYWQFSLRGAELETVVVTPKKKRYSKRGNPAVAIIEKAIAHKEKHRVEQYNDLSYQVYRRQLIGLTDSLQTPFGALFGIHSERWQQWSDSSAFEGLKVRPFSIRESHSVRAHIGGKRLDELLIGKRFEGLEEALEGAQMSANLERIMPEINFYDNDLYLFHYSLPGPMSRAFSTSFYKYYLLDTVTIEGRPTFRIGVMPFSPRSMGFKGTLWIDTASYALAQVHLSIPKESNIEWISDCYVTARYAPKVMEGDTLWLPQRQELHVLMTPSEWLRQSAEFNQLFCYTHFRRGEAARDSIALDPRKALPIEMQRAMNRPKKSSFGLVTRPEVLPPLGEGTLAMMQYVRRDPIYIITAKGVQLFSRGFLGLPINKLRREDYYGEIGPLEAMVAWNAIEGIRLRMGGMTSARLSRFFFAQGYVGYGFGDKQWKYYGRLIYTPIAKEVHENEYPRRNFSLTMHRDLFVPGYAEDPMYKDGLGTLLGTMMIRQRYYSKSATAAYFADLNKSWQFGMWANLTRQTSAGSLRYYKINELGEQVQVPSIQSASVGLSVTFTPGREPIDNRRTDANTLPSRFHPTITLTTTLHPKGMFGNNSTKGFITASFSNRFYLSLFGYMDTSISSGIALGKVDETDFFTPAINASWIFSRGRFQLMQPLEFVADKYLEFGVDYHLRGLILNRIPLINRLGWREVLSFRGYWGDVSAHRLIPYEGQRVYPTSVAPMNNHLYCEGSIGLENILKVLNIHYFHRFTPSQQPDAPKWGIKIGGAVSF